MKRILVATDGSEGGDRAVDYATRLAKTVGAELLIVNIANLSDLQAKKEFEELARVEHTSVGELLTAFSERVLVSAVDRAKQHGASMIQTRSGHGNVARAILEIAHRENASPIVVGRRGLGRWEALFLGSVSNRLANLAPQAVVVVP